MPCPVSDVSKVSSVPHCERWMKLGPGQTSVELRLPIVPEVIKEVSAAFYVLFFNMFCTIWGSTRMSRADVGSVWDVLCFLPGFQLLGLFGSPWGAPKRSVSYLWASCQETYVCLDTSLSLISHGFSDVTVDYFLILPFASDPISKPNLWYEQTFDFSRCQNVHKYVKFSCRLFLLDFFRPSCSLPYWFWEIEHVFLFPSEVGRERILCSRFLFLGLSLRSISRDFPKTLFH